MAVLQNFMYFWDTCVVTVLYPVIFFLGAKRTYMSYSDHVIIDFHLFLKYLYNDVAASSDVSFVFIGLHTLVIVIESLRYFMYCLRHPVQWKCTTSNDFFREERWEVYGCEIQTCVGRNDRGTTEFLDTCTPDCFILFPCPYKLCFKFINTLFQGKMGHFLTKGILALGQLTLVWFLPWITKLKLTLLCE